MQLFGRSYRCELIKLLARKKFIVFLALEVAICGIVLLVQLALEHVSGLAFNVNLRMMLLGFFISAYIPLVSFMAVCDLFSSELQDGSLRASLLLPASRFKVYLAKALSAYTVAVVYLFSLFVVTAVLELSFGSTLHGFFESFGSYLLDAIPLAVVILMAVFFNQILRSPTLAMLLCIGVLIAAYIVNIFLPQVGAMLFTSYGQWHNLFIGKALPFLPMMMKVGLLVGYGTVFFSAGYYIFERRDM